MWIPHHQKRTTHKTTQGAWFEVLPGTPRHHWESALVAPSSRHYLHHVLRSKKRGEGRDHHSQPHKQPHHVPCQTRSTNHQPSLGSPRDRPTHCTQHINIQWHTLHTYRGSHSPWSALPTSPRFGSGTPWTWPRSRRPPFWFTAPP